MFVGGYINCWECCMLRWGSGNWYVMWRKDVYRDMGERFVNKNKLD